MFEYIEFKNLEEFIEKKEDIIDEFSSFLCPFFDKEEVSNYKKYIYGKKLSKTNTQEDRIWEFLNGDIDEEILCLILSNLKLKNCKKKFQEKVSMI